MIRSLSAFALALVSAGIAVSCSTPPPNPQGDEWAGPQGTWQQMFFDDFNGPAGSSPNAASWNLEVNGRPANAEQEYYTSRPSNLALDGNGNLVIQALQEHYAYATGLMSNQPYTSGRLNTKSKVETTYGRIEARIKLPTGKGMWPAFWMLGTNYDSVGWPGCGEIDIMELAGSEPNKVNGSLHAPGYSGVGALTGSFQLDSGDFGDDFHIFAVEWAPDGIRWLVDEQPYEARTVAGIQSLGEKWIFNHPFDVILNLAVGGNYDGDPDSSTQFPAQMLVDYVKVSSFVPN